MKLRSIVSTASAALLAVGLSIAITTPAQADQSTPGSYNKVAPVRVLDTRSGVGAARATVRPLGTVSFAIPTAAGRSIGAVLLEVTVVNPTGSGYVTVYPSGAPRPVVSNVNFQQGRNVPNMVVVRVGVGNKVNIFNGSGGTVDLLADIQGYFQAGTNTVDPGTLVSVVPARFLDTRIGVGVAVRGKVAPGSAIKLKLAGRGGIPANASAVAVNITAVRSPGRGYITVYPGDPRPVTSTVNFEAGQDRANLALAQIGADGTISLYNGSPYPVDLLADVSGYFVGGGVAAADGSYTPSSTVRVVDTRQFRPGFVPSLSTLRLRIFPAGDPFITYVKAVAVNVASVDPQAAGFLTTWDGATTVPAVSNVNFQARRDAAGSIVVPVNADGTISIYNGSFGNLDMVVDLDGLFFQLPTAAAARTAPDAHRSAPTAAQILADAHAFLSTSHRPTVTRHR